MTKISSFETQAMVAVSISEGIDEAAGRTKTRGAPASPALGPEHRAAPPPAVASPPLHETPMEPRQTTLTSRRGAQQAGVESEGRARPPCKAMSGADTQVCTQVAAEPPLNAVVPPLVLGNSSDEQPPVPKEVPATDATMGALKENARNSRRSSAAPQVDSAAKPAALESIKSTPRRSAEAQSTAAHRLRRYRPPKAPQTGREPPMPSPNARHHPLAHPLNECRQPKLQPAPLGHQDARGAGAEARAALASAPAKATYAQVVRTRPVTFKDDGTPLEDEEARAVESFKAKMQRLEVRAATARCMPSLRT